MKSEIIFIVTSGRSGSRLLFKLFDNIKGVDSNHEFNLMEYKPEIIKYLYSKSETDFSILNSRLNKYYYNYIVKTENNIWVDSNYAISSILDIIISRFPNAKILHIVRNGLKVVSSWKNKLGGEIYNNNEMENLNKFLTNRDTVSEPDRDKKNWWFIPNKKESIHKIFKESNQFEKICYHWVFSYQWVTNIVEEKKIAHNYRLAKLEDIIHDENNLKSIFKFIGIDYYPKYFYMIQKPHNVTVPINFKLTADQRRLFFKICGGLMNDLDYDCIEEYNVKYDLDKD
tara:strand:+ start:60 stop:914 length:855 start_codon:yes stop_codon:yes gene_type:complete